MALINVCYGCLSTERKSTLIKDHTKLYRQLLLEKSKKNAKKLFMCWECHKILNNIHAFRLKITQAQRFLCNKVLPQQSTLSNLSTLTKTDIYDLTIYEDDKINITKSEVEVKFENESSDNVEEEYIEEEYVKEEEVEINTLKEELKDEDDSLDNTIIEASDDVKDNIDDSIPAADVNDDLTDIDDKPDDLVVPVETLQRKDLKVELGRRKRRVLKKKYRIIVMDDARNKRNLYEIVTIDQKDAAMEIKKRTEKRKQFRCSLCFCGFSQQKYYDRHVNLFHNQMHEYSCDVCAFRFPNMRGVRKHVPTHFKHFRCKLCMQQFSMRDKLYSHFRHGPHARQMECKKCFQRFDCRKRKEFFDHYRDAHEFYVCDHCGCRRTSKVILAKHIKGRHIDTHCKLCNTTFSKSQSLKAHIERKHITDASERNYCVECDIQFTNSQRYEEHVSRSTKHNPNKPRVKCLECDKTYSKHSYMKNHYNLVHLKSTKYVCSICKRHFLNGFRLRWHIKYHHEKAPKPRNCICNFCGKGFTTRRTRDNHVRTHTGERPYECARCPAAFAQAVALKTHERAHK